MDFSERDRQRYEVNTGYKGWLEQRGTRFYGMLPDDVLPEITGLGTDAIEDDR